MKTKQLLRTIILSILVGVLPCSIFATNYYVSSGSGNDAWSGRLSGPNSKKTDGPFKTLGMVASVIQAGDICFVRGGVYSETLTLSISGTQSAPITIQNFKSESPVISGADPITDWNADGKGVYSAAMSWDLEDQNQLFANGVMLTEARWPNNTGTMLQPSRAIMTAGTETTITDPNLPGDDDFWKDALLWCSGGQQWFCWATRITAYDAKTKTLTFDPEPVGTPRFYSPRKGNFYVLMGVRNALDVEGEWWFDRTDKRLYFRPHDGKNPNTLHIEAKRRIQVINLSGCSNVRIIGLQFRAGSIQTDDKSSAILLKSLKGEYLGHSFKKDISDIGAVVIRGRNIEVNQCEFAFGSGSLLNVQGEDNRIINCYIHDGDYAAKWKGTVSISGRRHVIAYNTIRHSGRDLVSIGGMSEAIVEYNDLSFAGWLTDDLGMMYGHSTDFQNTVIRYNQVHDNMTKNNGKGIYFDHLSMNAIVYSNIIWNVSKCPIKFNNPSYFDLAFNNTSYNTYEVTTYDHSNRKDMYGMRFYNNIVNKPFILPDNVLFAGNLVSPDPDFADPMHQRFDLKSTSPAIAIGVPIAGVTSGLKPDAGAIPYGKTWKKVGHDFENPPTVPMWQAPDIAYMNGIRNSCFEYGIEGWDKTGAGKAQTVRGNGWGNQGGLAPGEPTGTCRGELRLGDGIDGVEQTITGLFPNTSYTLSGWVKVSDPDESIRLVVSDSGGTSPEASFKSNSAIWTRLIVEFKTGSASTTAKISLQKTSNGPGYVFADNLGLPRLPHGD